MSRLAKFRDLTWPERRLLFVALVLLPMTALGLRLFGFRRTQAVLHEDVFCGAGSHDGDLARAQKTARIVAAAARYGPYRATCLPVALTLGRLLQGRGIATELRLGVSKADARLDAHAWVEYQGVPLIDLRDVHQRYAAFDKAVPPAAAAPK
jgi:hypothetical protein